ncbi:hypothetical protein [Priestia megaterium]|uniref:hypothetical protein n=1 Tax=Priestia megaterium TaxID=1404 RepID=UPI000BFB6150|nr:hypothetical protein [Priestia megaterium]PGO60595.1 hypothetical protein CN981_08585 [Priestia megaterium]
MNELYALGVFDAEGNFKHFVRKGRGNAIYAYDSIQKARRGYNQSVKSVYDRSELKILKASTLEILEEN